MSNFIVGKKYRMRNGELAEILSFMPESYAMSVRIPDGRILWAGTDGQISSVSLFDYDIISDTPIEKEEDEINFRNPFKMSSVKRRHFDVSRLKEPTRPPNGYVEDEYNYAWEKSKWDTQQEVLEAYNEGRIEELLESWTTTESKENGR